MTSHDLRQAVAAAAQALHREGLVVGTAGNVSVRAAKSEAMHITPTGMAYESLSGADIVTVTFDGNPVEGAGLPSAESLLHGAIYRARPDAGAVVHAHPLFASVLAVRHEEIPPIVDEQVIYLGGGVGVSEYAPAGSDQLAANALQALGMRNAALLANHGTVAVGRDPAHALDLTRLVERLARIWYFAAARPGAQRLPDEIVQAEMELFAMLQHTESV